MSNWLWTWLSCKRRFPQPEEPSLRKVRKLLGADTRVQANRGNEEVGYETLVSKREETNSALLGRKVRLLKTVLRRAELVSLTGTKELYKSLPLDLNPADDAEATSYSPHRALEPINSESASFRFGLSGLRIKDVSCIQEGRLLQELVSWMIGPKCVCSNTEPRNWFPGRKFLYIRDCQGNVRSTMF